MQARSVIPGRQRWNIGIVLAGPGVAESLEDTLRQVSGVEAVHANPLTGRLLVHHDTTLTSQDVEQLVREAVVLAVQEAVAHPRSSRPTPSAVPARVRRRHGGLLLLVLVGGAILAVILVRFIRWSPPLPRGPVPAATVVLFRRTWGESLSFQQALLSSPLFLASLSSSPLLFLVFSSPLLSLPPSVLSSMSSFASSPFSFLLFSSPLSSAIPPPLRSSFLSLSSFSANPFLYLFSAPPEWQNHYLPSGPRRLLRDRDEDQE